MSLTRQQLELRRTGYGASEIAALVGLSRWQKPIDVYGSKTLPLEELDSLPADLGNLLEDPTAEIYRKRTGRFLRRVFTLRHPTLELALATPDRAVFLTEEDAAAACPVVTGPEGDLLLELRGTECERLAQVKTTAQSNRREWGPPGTDHVPEEVLIQVTWEMGVTGVPLCDVPVLFRGDFGVELEVFTVPFNAPMFENLYGMVERFHVEHVLAGVPPPADGSSRYEEFLKKVYPVARRPPIIADAETNERLLRFAKLKEASDRLKRALKLERNELVRIIGDTSGITSLEYGTLSYKHTKDRLLVDWRKAASDFQIVAALLVKRLPVEARPAVEARVQRQSFF